MRILRLVDDLAATYEDNIDITADETVQFHIDDEAYEIDLTDKNARALRKIFEEFIAVARVADRPVRGQLSPIVPQERRGGALLDIPDLSDIWNPMVTTEQYRQWKRSRQDFS